LIEKKYYDFQFQCNVWFTKSHISLDEILQTTNYFKESLAYNSGIIERLAEEKTEITAVCLQDL